jgi:hypothetical protein
MLLPGRHLASCITESTSIQYATKCLGDHMSEQKKEIWLEGIVHASRYDPSAQGKQFLGAAIECSDGKVWVIDYSEQSPFHVFAGRQVVVSGEPYKPEGQGQHLIGWRGVKKLGHFRVSTMRLVQVTPDAKLVEVGGGQHLCGRFERGTSETGESMVSFVTEEGDAFLVANDPAGATVGPVSRSGLTLSSRRHRFRGLVSNISGSSAHVQPQIFGSGVSGTRDPGSVWVPRRFAPGSRQRQNSTVPASSMEFLNS